MRVRLANERASGAKGFTLWDLLATVASVGLFLFLLIPANGSSQSAAKTAICHGNLRTLAMAWNMYAEENGGTFVENVYGGDFQVTPSSNRRPWAVGWLDWQTSSDNTNMVKLVEVGRLAPFFGRDPKVFKCPADTYRTASMARFGYERVRSYSMNVRVGVVNSFFFDGYDYLRFSDVRDITTDRLAVFVEEHPDSINDPAFIVDDSTPRWIDIPGSNHEYSGALSFMDGHAEIKRWVSPSTRLPVRFVFNSPLVPRNDPDYLWMRARFGGRPRP